jgi:hypothetical protein
MSGAPLQPPPKNLDRLNLQEQMKETGRWMFEVYRRLKDTGILAILWTNLDFTGSKLTDIITRAHADLQLILGLDPTSTDTTKNKHVSNAQGKKWEDHVDASTNVHGIGAGSSVMGTTTAQTVTNKTILIPHTSTGVNLTLSTQNIVKITAAVTITVPTAVGVAGRVYVLDNAHAGVTTVNPSGAETIEGETSQTLTGQCCLSIHSDGVGWRFM